MRCSYLEIYNEVSRPQSISPIVLELEWYAFIWKSCVLLQNLTDLLNTSNKNLRIRENMQVKGQCANVYQQLAKLLVIHCVVMSFNSAAGKY